MRPHVTLLHNSFCPWFLIGQDQRIESFIFANKHQVGSLFSRRAEEKDRNASLLDPFPHHHAPLASPLGGPVDGDIHIIDVVNPFYAAPANPLERSSSVPVVNTKAQKLYIVTVSVCLGISRVDTISLHFNADWIRHADASTLGIALYMILLRMSFKPSEMVMQSALHAFFLTTPFKFVPLQQIQVVS